MRIKPYISGMLLLCVTGLAIAPPVYAGADDSTAPIKQYARRGRGGHGHGDGHDYGHRKFFRHRRYYPSDYYYHRKIYYPARRKYYFYFDVYPRKHYYYGDEYGAYSYNTEYLSITSIANMASQGVPDAVIIAEIERTRSTYKLNSQIITYLRQNGASDAVINFMLSYRKY